MKNEQWWYRHCVAMFILGAHRPQTPDFTVMYLFFI
jgi:hypothetical protein